MPYHAAFFFMKYYWVKTHPIVRHLFRKYVWRMPSKDKTIYLTFDDGPTEEITDWVLDQLQKFDARATFFLIGKNVEDLPEIAKSIANSGHSIGNHTYNHVNGWHVPYHDYIENVDKCDQTLQKLGIATRLFRPPYGKLTRLQSGKVLQDGYKVYMWDILSADFDVEITPEKCLDNVLRNICPGSIIIFHDSKKAFRNLEYVLPRTLEYLKKEGYECAAL